MRRTTLVLVFAAVVCSVAVGSASGTVQRYCDNVTLAGGAHCDGARHTLWANIVNVPTNTRLCAGQLDQNGNFTGSYSCANGNAFKCYPGNSSLLYPRLHNGTSNNHNGYTGQEGWGTPVGACPP